MNSNGFRRVAVGAASAVLVAGLVAGCNGGSTSAAPPGSAATASTRAASSAARPAAHDASQVCTNTDGTLLVPGVVDTSTAKGNWGTALTIAQDGHGSRGAVSVSVSAPVSKKQPAAEHLRLDRGQVYLLIKVSVTYRSGGRSTVGAPYFVLRDPQHNSCSPGGDTTLVPDREAFDSGTVSKAAPTYAGTLVFKVPAGQDYRRYTLSYGPSDQQTVGKQAVADAAWTA